VVPIQKASWISVVSTDDAAPTRTTEQDEMAQRESDARQFDFLDRDIHWP
jgi:hypothetical protein